MSYYAPTIRSNSYNVKVYNDTYTLTDDETKNGFVFFRNGITIPDNTTLTLDTPARVSGTISSSGDYVSESASTLKLGGDLIFGSDVSLPVSQYLKIDGNGHVLHLSGDFAPSVGGGLILHGDIVIDGHGNCLSLAPSSYLHLDSNATVTLRNMVIKLNANTTPSQPLTGAGDNTSRLCLENVTLDLNADYSFGYGRLYISGDVVVRGLSWISPSTLNYTSTYPMLIQSNSMLTFDIGSEFVYNPGGTGTTDASATSLLNMADPTSVLYFNGSTLSAPSHGLNLYSGTLILGNRVYIYNNGATSAGDGINLGDGVSGSNNVNVYLLAGARVEISSGYLNDKENGLVG
jgi:hypothetical protein